MDTTNARPPPPKVTFSMLEAASKIDNNGATSSMKETLANQDEDDSLIAEIEEIQSDEYELPSSPIITKEMFDAIYPALPTMKELVRLVHNILTLNTIQSLQCIHSNIVLQRMLL